MTTHKKCNGCGGAFIPRRRVQRFCSRRCGAENASHAAAGTRMSVPVMDRIHANVEISEATGCWIWMGATGNGYGRMSYHGRLEYVHRIVAAHFHGPCPGGQEVMHACDVRRCCNPEHLSYGTRAENLADMVRKGRSTRGIPRPHRRKERTPCPVCGKPFLPQALCTGKMQVTCSIPCRDVYFRGAREWMGAGC